jgi:hypothetical protein
MSPAIRAVLVAAAILFVIFRVYQRVRGSIGRQPLRQTPLMVRALLLLLVAGAALVLSSPSLLQLLYAFGGAVIGAGIAAYALSHPRIEQTNGRYFYIGHPYIGLGIVGLFLARLLFNLAMVYSELHSAAAQDRHAILARMESDPFTLGSLLLVASYYCVYSLGLLRRTRT